MGSKSVSIAACSHERFNEGTLQICESGCGQPRLVIEGYDRGRASLAAQMSVLEKAVRHLDTGHFGAAVQDVTGAALDEVEKIRRGE